MPVPDFQTLMRPALVALEDGQPHRFPQIRETLAGAIGVTDADQTDLLPSGKQTVFANRVAWALTHLGQAGLVIRPVRAQYVLSDRGSQVLAEQPDRPAGQWNGERAATDILVLARKGKAFRSLDKLLTRQGASAGLGRLRTRARSGDRRLGQAQ